MCDVAQRPNTSFKGYVRIISASPPFMLVRVVNGLSVWRWRFLLFSLSSLIFCASPSNSQNNFSVCFSFRFDSYIFLLPFVLFHIVYEIDFFLISSSISFFVSRFSPHSFNYYLLIIFELNFMIGFFFMISSSINVFSYISKLIFILFIVVFFT